MSFENVRTVAREGQLSPRRASSSPRHPAPAASSIQNQAGSSPALLDAKGAIALCLGSPPGIKLSKYPLMARVHGMLILG